jgi:hypothetical protein
MDRVIEELNTEFEKYLVKFSYDNAKNKIKFENKYRDIIYIHLSSKAFNKIKAIILKYYPSLYVVNKLYPFNYILINYYREHKYKNYKIKCHLLPSENNMYEYKLYFGEKYIKSTYHDKYNDVEIIKKIKMEIKTFDKFFN